MAPTIDLTCSEHREALRFGLMEALSNADRQPRPESWPLGAFDHGMVLDAIRSLSSPTGSAALVRALLGAAKCEASVSYDRLFFEQPNGAWHEHWWLNAYEWPDGVRLIGEIEPRDVPILILSLLDAKDREAAIAALLEGAR